MRQSGNASNRSDDPSSGHAREIPAACLLNDPEHPDHALYLLLGERLSDAGHPKWGPGQRIRLAAAMVVSARAAGLERVDELVLSKDFSTGKLIHKPCPDNNLLNRSTEVNVAKALRTPLAESSDQWLRTITQQMREQFELWEQQGILWEQMGVPPPAPAIGPRR